MKNVKLPSSGPWASVFSPERTSSRGDLPCSSVPFPMRKSADPIVIARTKLMRDLLMHMETDPDVVVVAAYPEEVDYWTIATNGEPNLLTHVPDMAVLRSDGTVAVIDTVSRASRRKEGPRLAQRTADLKAHYATVGASYYLLDERAIHLQPLFDNRRDIWQHQSFSGQNPEIDRVAAAIMQQPLPLSIGQLAKRIPTLCPSEELNDESGPLYSAVKQLVMSGLIEVDLARRFSFWTVLRFPSSSHDGVQKHRGLRFSAGVARRTSTGGPAQAATR